MPETAQEYVQRILGTMGDADPLKVLAKFSPEQLRKRPVPEKWSAAEIVIHLSEVEMMVGVRVRLVVGTNWISIQGFDQDAWASRYANTDLPLALDAFYALRAANLAMYRALTPEDWEHYGMHSERGKEGARRIVAVSYTHLSRLRAH